MNQVELLFYGGLLIVIIGLLGVISRKNLLSILMFQELSLNGVNLVLVAGSILHHNYHGAILSFITFIVTAAEMAIAILILLLLIKKRKTLDVTFYSELKG
ncbi:MAG: NADH-quinone oxidoreductase subunit NuoK [Oligoflexia bacterium]|nr:NADH-quinone oxidoreductase subunit NuoK [Oligoflexia bacterium]MBF0366266.1 NADH-quinone oxidoreductase subunit NuoK [Oligoflexia bacterium]